MRNIINITLVMTSLLVGAASATTTATSGSRTMATAHAELHAAVLLDAQGRVVGTIDHTGQVIRTTTARAATHVRVTFEGGVTRTYTLAGAAQASAQVTLDTLVVLSGGHMATLGQTVRAEAQAQARASADAALRTRPHLEGKTVKLVDASGSTVGTFDADGTLRASGDVRQATDVVVTLKGGREISYDLATTVKAGASGMLRVTDVTVRDHDRAVALVSVLVTLRTTAEDSARPATTTTDAATTATTTTTTTTTTGNASASGNVGTGGASVTTTTGIGVSIGGGLNIGIGIGGRK